MIDEYTFTQHLGLTATRDQLKTHWNSWIMQDDFNEIASMGSNHVRIPIGYWAINPLPGEPYVQGQIPILDNAIGWARNASLKVLLDLHEGKFSRWFIMFYLTFVVSGSQNGLITLGARNQLTGSK